MRSKLSTFLAMGVFAILLIATIVQASSFPCYYDMDNLPLLGETTLTTGIKTDNLAEYAVNKAGACLTSFYCRIDRRSDGSSGSWVSNSDNYLVIANTTSHLDFYNVTPNSTVRLQGWRYNFNAGRVVGNIIFY